ncbi:hypothetical protein BH09GEM1_BH09GEM1_25670 [soil metagenome]
MNVRTLTRLTNAGLLAGIGMVAGHLLMPARATATIVARVAFIASIAGTGALAGWRERRGRELDGGEELGSQPVWILGGVIAALAAAWIAYRAAHG